MEIFGKFCFKIRLPHFRMNKYMQEELFYSAIFIILRPQIIQTI